MKIGKTKSMILLLFLCCSKFFISGSYIKGVYYLDVICFMLFGWCFLNMMTNKFLIPIGKIKNSEFFYPILAFWGMTIVEMLYSFIRYRQPILSTVKMSYFHFVLVVYFVLIGVVDSKEKLDSFKHMLVLFCTICNFFQIVYRGLYSGSWNPYFYLTMLSFPFVMSNIIVGKQKKLTMLNLLTTIICIFLVGENTAIRIAFIMVMFSSVLVHTIMKAKRKDNQLIIRGILLLFVSICVFGGVIKTYIENIINSGVGNQVRIYAMKYYWNKFVNSPIFGMGFIDPNISEEFYKLVHGEVSPLGGMSQYFIEDVGIVGYIAQFGLLGIVVLTWILLKVYTTIKNSKETMLIENIGLLALVLVMFISLMPTNKAPIQIFPVFLILLEKNAQVSRNLNGD